MAHDARKEDYQRLGLRFIRELDKEEPLRAMKTFAGFGQRFATDRDSLPQTDADRAFHLVSLAADAPELGQYLSGYVLPSGLRGWTLVRVDGLSLGWAKGDGTQLKNHYPKALRRPV